MDVKGAAFVGAVRILAFCMAMGIGFTGCGKSAPNISPAEALSTESTYGSGSVHALSPQMVTFSDERIIFGEESPGIDEKGNLIPQKVQGTERIQDDLILNLDISLPEGWTLKQPEKGESVYAAMLGGSINIYADGACVGTIGYDRFTAEIPEQWSDYGFTNRPKDYQWYYHWLMTGSRNWDNEYTVVMETDTVSAATCKIRYDADYLNSDKDYYNAGILYCDTELGRFVGVEFEAGAVTHEQLAMIAESMRLSGKERWASPMLPPPCAEAPEGYVNTAVAFSAYEDDIAALYASMPFALHMALPLGWSLREQEDRREETPRLSFKSMDIYDGEQIVGSVGCSVYEVYPGTTEENYYRMVYNQLMLGSIVNWDNDYTPVTMTETACTAICRVARKDRGPIEGPMANAPVRYNPAILSYDEKWLVYAALSFEDGSVTGEQLQAIAKSIRFKPGNQQTG